MTKEFLSKIGELSTLAQFHLAPDLFGDNEIDNVVKHPEIACHQVLINKKVKEILDCFCKPESPEGTHIMELMKRVMNLEPDADSPEFESDKKKLDLCKKKIMQMLDAVLESIEEYIASIIVLDEASRQSDIRNLGEYDNARTLKHNKLIDAISILNRSLLWWFGDFDGAGLSGNLEKMYEKQEDLYISHNFERTEIPPNGICPQKYNIKDRKQITEWAKNIYMDIASVKRGIKEVG